MAILDAIAAEDVAGVLDGRRVAARRRPRSATDRRGSPAVAAGRVRQRRERRAGRARRAAGHPGPSAHYRRDARQRDAGPRARDPRAGDRRHARHRRRRSAPRARDRARPTRASRDGRRARRCSSIAWSGSKRVWPAMPNRWRSRSRPFFANDAPARNGSARERRRLRRRRARARPRTRRSRTRRPRRRLVAVRHPRSELSGGRPPHAARARKRPPPGARVGRRAATARTSEPDTTFELDDVIVAWAAVLDALPRALRASIQEAQPLGVEGNVIVFGVARTHIDAVKPKFQKNADAIREVFIARSADRRGSSSRRTSGTAGRRAAAPAARRRGRGARTHRGGRPDRPRGSGRARGRTGGRRSGGRFVVPPRPTPSVRRWSKNSPSPRSPVAKSKPPRTT